VVAGAHTHADAPGLHFIGQTNPLTGQLREIRLEAEQIARALKRPSGRTGGDRAPAEMRWRSQALRAD
jgi:hypothetical protein